MAMDTVTAINFVATVTTKFIFQSARNDLVGETAG